MEQTQWVYDFTEGSRDMRELLGGKGANVAEMTRVLGEERVPAGFTITTEACVEYMKADQEEPEGLAEEVAEALGRLEERAGKKLGDNDDPLLVSVRSGARESMPGMLDTVLNLGLNDESVEGLAEATENERFAWDSYRRFVQMFGNVSHGVPGEQFEDAIKEVKSDRGVKDDTELDVDALKELTNRFKELYDFPQDPQEQLRQAIRAVFDSWLGNRAVEYRRLNRIPDEWGTAVNVQQMVFGNKGDTSATGVAFSRDEVTGEPEPSGDFLVNAQGEDVVSGVRNTRDIAELADVMPETHKQLMEILRTLERHYKDMQDVEFTVEEGQLYMLQTRSAKRPAQAAVRFACDAVEEELLTKEEALTTIDAGSPRRAAAPDVRPEGGVRGAGQRRQRVARRGQGRGRVHRRRGRRGGRSGPRRDPRAPVHRGRRRGRLPRRQGDPHVGGRQGLACRARRARHGTPGRGRRQRADDRPQGEGDPRRRQGDRRGRLHRDRRHERLRHARGCAAARAGGQRELRARARVGRRDPPPRRPGERRHAGGRQEGPRARRRGHRALPHRAHVHGRGPPAEDAGDDHGRRHRDPQEGAGRAAPAPAGGLRGPLRSDARAAGDDPPARPAAARVPAEPARAARGRRARPDRVHRQPRRARAAALAGGGDPRGEPDARHPRRAASGSSYPRSTRCRSRRSCGRPRRSTRRRTRRS